MKNIRKLIKLFFILNLAINCSVLAEPGDNIITDGKSQKSIANVSLQQGSSSAYSNKDEKKSSPNNFTLISVYNELKSTLDKFNMVHSVSSKYFEKYADSDMSKFSDERLGEIKEFIQIALEDFKKLTEEEKSKLLEGQIENLSKSLNVFLEKIAAQEKKRKIKEILSNGCKTAASGLGLGVLVYGAYKKLTTVPLLNRFLSKKNEFDKNLQTLKREVVEPSKIEKLFSICLEPSKIEKLFSACSKDESILNNGRLNAIYHILEKIKKDKLYNEWKDRDIEAFKKFQSMVFEKGEACSDLNHLMMKACKDNFEAIGKLLNNDWIFRLDANALKIENELGEIVSLNADNSKKIKSCADDKNYLIKIDKALAHGLLICGSIIAAGIVVASIYYSIKKIRELLHKEPKEENLDDLVFDDLEIDDSFISTVDQNDKPSSPDLDIDELDELDDL